MTFWSKKHCAATPVFAQWRKSDAPYPALGAPVPRRSALPKRPIPRLAQRLFRLLLAGALALAVAPAVAAPLAGQDDPAFAAALALWLADDEAAALPALAALAHDDNRAAQILLGLIDREPALQGPFLAHLPRARRLEMLRAPGGLSGRNWLASARSEPLAQAWVDLADVRSGPEVIDAFRTLHEELAWREAAITLAARGHPALDLLAPQMGDTELLYLVWSTATPERRQRIEARLPPGDAPHALMAAGGNGAALVEWLATSPAAAPLASLCSALCPTEVQTACLLGAYGALDSHNGLLILGTPAEALVPQSAFLATPRGLSTVMRRLLLSVDMSRRRALITRVTEESDCLGQALGAENTRYRPPLPGTPNDG